MGTRGGRAHLVLVPGFGGFDALGQLEYYAGTTAALHRFQRLARESVPGAERAVLHYFDNLPTAAVRTRANRLLAYLAKRVARNEIQPDDTIALIGHSTGGLDIRHLLATMGGTPQARRELDGAPGVARSLEHRELLQRIRRVVFLSVPQSGTRLADWVQSQLVWLTPAISAMSRGFEVSRRSNNRWLQLLGVDERAMGDLVVAVTDALAECDEGAFGDDVEARVAAREARSELSLWLQNIDSDFMAIRDLSVRAPDGRELSPAHHSPERRQYEQAVWKEYGIETRSYATRAPNPFGEGGLAGPMPLSPFGLLKSMYGAGADGRTDVAFRLGYRLCASGTATLPALAHATAWSSGERVALRDWDNDGVVNTTSMLWPHAATTRVVDADHGDVIGHYALRELPPARGRRYSSYDLLRSGAGFGDAEFEKLWAEIFDFCVR